ncbi:putative uncharacterized protein DDB_G0290521 [Bradysia coprophila]|uniref:putative uncharacterized protein DDB_G0290521 n=1 Tax=Bradysia coprophila TaxID=38358 RepID=UPI00187DA974|nr:putative uncharacterized protein DDB_G0290521 [Bradysia coprophila]
MNESIKSIHKDISKAAQISNGSPDAEPDCCLPISNGSPDAEPETPESCRVPPDSPPSMHIAANSSDDPNATIISPHCSVATDELRQCLQLATPLQAILVEVRQKIFLNPAVNDHYKAYFDDMLFAAREPPPPVRPSSLLPSSTPIRSPTPSPIFPHNISPIPYLTPSPTPPPIPTQYSTNPISSQSRCTNMQHLRIRRQ